MVEGRRCKHIRGRVDNNLEIPMYHLTEMEGVWLEMSDKILHHIMAYFLKKNSGPVTYITIYTVLYLKCTVQKSMFDAGCQ